MRPSTLAIGFGAGRALVGVALLAAPAPIARAWVGADDTPTTVLARSLGARDLVIGAGLVLAAARDGGNDSLAAYFAAQLPKAHVLVERLNKR